MNSNNRIIKRVFDLILSSFGLVLFGWLIIITAIIARLDTGLSGFFVQNRVGQHSKVFKVIKLRSMKNIKGLTTTVSTAQDPRITKIGKFWRKSKLDELPQLINVFLGQMSFVGPRPDVQGFADKLKGIDKIILSIKPGITGPASIYFRNEEDILANQSNPEEYNMNVIWPKKIEINKKYIEDYSITKDIIYIFRTIF